tara:strand:+ start:259 stop:699 length:441 start_codon:yes stop_codon:yes gene_type:complete
MYFKSFYEFLGTFFYIGFIPVAPGTFASFFAAFIWILVPDNIFIKTFFLLLVFLLAMISYKKLKSNKKYFHDPNFFVLDEVIGMWIALFYLPKSIFIYVISFCLFRFFDILKPSFIYYIDKRHNNLSIIMDDIAAGLITFLICSQI